MIVLLFVIGLIFGSFINALVWRLKNKRDWVHERSECPHCGHRLGVMDLIPVISWLALKGRCRYCKKAISKQYPVVELLTGILFALSYVAWPEVLSGTEVVRFAVWLVLLVHLVALMVYDARYMLLPNKLVWPAAAPVAAITIIETISQTSVAPMVGAVFGLLSFGGLFYVLFQVSNGKWIGGGDVKLGFVLGAWLASVYMSILAIFVASVLGLVALPVLAYSKKVTMKSRIPFGPMLILATIFVTLYGERVLEAYSLMLGF